MFVRPARYDTDRNNQLNVLIADCGRALLADFGLSRVKSDLDGHTTGSLRESIVGSRHWMSPERYIDHSPKKPSDIYAFAMTIYEVRGEQWAVGITR